MNQTQNTYSLDEHEVALSQTSNRLLLEIEAKSTGRIFSLELENDAVPQVTNEIFTDVNTMYQGLEDALKKAYKEVVLAFDDQGKLTYKVSFSLGTIKKDLHFVLSFQEKKIDPLTRLEKMLENRLTAMDAKIAGIGQADKSKFENNQETMEGRIKTLEINNEGVMQQLNNFEKRVFEKLEALERKVASLEEFKANKYANTAYVDESISRLEQKLTEKNEKVKTDDLIEDGGNSDLTFNPQSCQVSYFTLSNNNKTAELTIASMDKEMLISKSLPQKGKFSFSLKLDKIGKYIYSGIVSTQDINKVNYYQDTLYYHLQNGSIYKQTAGSVINQKQPMNSSVGFGNEGDTLTVKFDIDQGRISFQVNQVEVNSIDTNLKDTSYIPYCGFQHPGSKITII